MALQMNKSIQLLLFLTEIEAIRLPTFKIFSFFSLRVAPSSYCTNSSSNRTRESTVSSALHMFRPYKAHETVVNNKTTLHRHVPKKQIQATYRHMKKCSRSSTIRENFILKKCNEVSLLPSWNGYQFFQKKSKMVPYYLLME